MPIGGHSPPPSAPGPRVCPLHPRTGLQPSLRLCVRLSAVCPRCSALSVRGAQRTRASQARSLVPLGSCRWGLTLCGLGRSVTL